jgi:hypothetical protein
MRTRRERMSVHQVDHLRMRMSGRCIEIRLRKGRALMMW